MYHDKSFLQKLQNKFGRYAIKSLMMYVVGAMGVVFFTDLLMPADIMPVRLTSAFAFNTAAIMQGEVWRIITFIAIPPTASPIFIVFALYLYLMIGSSLENQWGALKFNLFYLCGMIGTIIAGLITGFATSHFLNLSLFLAFAMLNPNFELRLFLILPVKMKWLALFNVAFLVFEFVINTWPGRAALLVSVINVLLFFGKDFVSRIRQGHRKAQWKKDIR